MRAQRSPLERAALGPDETAPEADLSRMKIGRRKPGTVTADRMAALEIVHSVSGPAEASAGDGLFFKKGFATAEGFRPSYWVYERRAEDEPAPAEALVAAAPTALATPPEELAALLEEEADAEDALHPLVGGTDGLEPEADLSKIIIRRVQYAPEPESEIELAPKAAMFEFPTNDSAADTPQTLSFRPQAVPAAPPDTVSPAPVAFVDEPIVLDPPAIAETIAPAPLPAAPELVVLATPIETPVEAADDEPDAVAALDAPSGELPRGAAFDAAEAALAPLAAEPALDVSGAAAAETHADAIALSRPAAALPLPMAEGDAAPSVPLPSPRADIAAPADINPRATAAWISLYQDHAAPTGDAPPAAPAKLELPPIRPVAPPMARAAAAPVASVTAPSGTTRRILPPTAPASGRAKAQIIAALPLVAELTAIIESVLSSKKYASQQPPTAAPQPQGRPAPARAMRKQAAARLAPPSASGPAPLILGTAPQAARLGAHRLPRWTWLAVRVGVLSLVVLGLWVHILTSWIADGRPLAEYLNPFAAAPVAAESQDAAAAAKPPPRPAHRPAAPR